MGLNSNRAVIAKVNIKGILEPRYGKDLNIQVLVKDQDTPPHIEIEIEHGATSRLNDLARDFRSEGLSVARILAQAAMMREFAVARGAHSLAEMEATDAQAERVANTLPVECVKNSPTKSVLIIPFAPEGDIFMGLANLSGGEIAWAKQSISEIEPYPTRGRAATGVTQR